MFRRALSLLLTLPLLLPPGVCVCALARIGEVCADDDSAVVASACCHHDDLPLDDGVALGDDDPDHDDTHHHPACPAHRAVVHWKCRMSPPELVVATAMSALLPRVLPDAGTNLVVATSFTSTRPIYLTTLTLRI